MLPAARPRLAQVSTSSEALSGTYAVLGRRRSRILREEMREGSDLFIGALRRVALHCALCCALLEA